MMGLYLLFLASVWLAVSVALAIFVAKKIPARWARVPAGIALGILILPLPVIDDIVGGRQFVNLCQENQSIYISPTAKGRTVYLAEPTLRPVRGVWLPVTLQEWRYLDVASGEVVVGFNTLVAGHGAIRFSDAPLTAKGSCEPGGQVDSMKLLKDNGITQIQRSALGAGGRK